jgi:hypothetical protein
VKEKLIKNTSKVSYNCDNDLFLMTPMHSCTFNIWFYHFNIKKGEDKNNITFKNKFNKGLFGLILLVCLLMIKRSKISNAEKSGFGLLRLVRL